MTHHEKETQFTNFRIERATIIIDSTHIKIT